MWNKDLSMKIEFYHSDFTTSGTKRNEKKDMDASKKIIYIFQNKNNFLISINKRHFPYVHLCVPKYTKIKT